jgi:glycosyltransferase involved in cell wall biosynthesis
VKGHRVLIEAFGRLAALRPDVHLIVAGEGPCRPDLEAQILRAGLRGRVTLASDVADPEVIYSLCDVVAYPSLNGIIGLTAIEAMACGVPVVASRLVGTEEFVAHGVTGWLVRPGDPAELAGGLARVLGDPTLRQRLGTSAREAVIAHHGMDRFIDAHIQLYRSVASERNGRRARPGSLP